MKNVGKKGKIGIFDSGLGGLLVAKAIQKKLPQYDYVYLGDTKRVPYGGRSHESVFEFAKNAAHYLFKKENCVLVIIACNTVSSRALRRLQQEYLPVEFSTKENKRILGVLIPAAEEASIYDRVGVLATVGTVSSGAFVDEIKKLNPETQIFQNPAPMLVPLIEEGEKENAKIFIKKYLKPLLKKNIQALVLGCTHYPLLKDLIKKEITMQTKSRIRIVSQDEITPKKLEDYLKRHKEIEEKISKKHSMKLLFTDITEQVVKLSASWFHKDVKPELVDLD